MVLSLIVLLGSITGFASDTIDVCDRGIIGQQIVTMTHSPSCDSVLASELASINEFYVSHQVGVLKDNVFSGMTGLKSIIASELTEIQSHAFAGLPSLKEIFIFKGSLTDLPNDVFQDVPNLTFLSIEGNLLTQFPAQAIRGLYSLDTLYLESNKITSIPADAFQDQSVLREISLIGNGISNIDVDAFSGLTQVISLRLSNNQLADVPTQALSVLGGSLEHLFIGSNPGITTLKPDAFSGLTHMIQLNLQEGNISTISDQAFRGLPPLYYLQMWGNPVTEISLTQSGLQGAEYSDIKLVP